MERGHYVVIEGSDGTGKTTQMNLLREHLEAQGRTVHITSEPADPRDSDEPLPVARELRKLIKNGDIERSPKTNLLLVTAARVEKWHREIAPALARGAYVLSSRNFYSTLAYQGYGEGLAPELIMQQTKLYLDGTRYLQPDAAVILTMSDDETRQSRIQSRDSDEQKDTFETRDQAFQRNVALGYLEVAKELSIPTVDANQTVEKVFADVVQALNF